MPERMSRYLTWIEIFLTVARVAPRTDGPEIVFPSIDILLVAMEIIALRWVFAGRMTIDAARMLNDRSGFFEQRD